MYFNPNGFAPGAIRKIGLDQTTEELSALEISVVALSRSDPQSSLHEGGWVYRLGKWMFGFERPNRLADPRLEALRRFSVLARIMGDRLPDAEQDDLLAAGFTAFQLTAAQRLARSPITPSRHGSWVDRSDDTRHLPLQERAAT